MFKKLTPLYPHFYERYLPTAFDESLTLLEKVNKIIQLLKEFGQLNNDMVDYLNEFIEKFDEKLYDSISDILNVWIEDGIIDKILYDILESVHLYGYDVHFANIKPGNTEQENTDAVIALNERDDVNVLFFRPGTYLMSEVPNKITFGHNAILRTPELDLYLDAVPQRVDSHVQNNQRLNNTITGINAAKFLNEASYGNTVYGSNAMNKSVDTRRNTAIGVDALERAEDSYSSTAIGAGAMQESKHTDRNTMVGGNAGKWIGTPRERLNQGHLFFTPNRDMSTIQGLWEDFRLFTGDCNSPNFYGTDRAETTSNVGIGRNALGFSILPKRNVSIGYNSMENALNGYDSVAIGECALQYGVKTEQSTAVGNRAMWGTAKNSQDTAIGCSTMKYLSDSAHNVAIGYQSMANLNRDRTIKPRKNVAVGRLTMANADTDYTGNTAVGESALLNVKGNYNTVVGFSAGYHMDTGIRNTFIGTNAGQQLKTNNNATALGYNALNSEGMDGFTNITGVGQNSTVTGSNQLQLGNSSTDVYAFNAVQTRSDERDKKDIQDSDLGLEFINKLRPVKFKWDLRDGTMNGKRNHYGLAAQELEKVTQELGVDFGGLQHHEVNGGHDVYSVGYTELISPLIKAVQELTNEVNNLKKEISELKG